MKPTLSVTNAPHIRTKETIKVVMWWVIAALMPALFFSIYYYGFSVMIPISLSVATCVIVEALIFKIRGKDMMIITDGSAILTGLLLAFNLPPGVPWWIPVVGGVVAIGIAKQAFGGLGYNIFNPALIGRAFLLTAWPVEMTTWSVDGVTGPTPLAIVKEHGMQQLIEHFGSSGLMYKNLIIGTIGGCIGETSAVLLLCGGIFLIYKKIISWHVPVSLIGTLFLCAWCFGGDKGFLSGDPFVAVFSGGIFLGAWYMATDLSTTPLTKKGKLIFGFGCGFITFMIRKFGAFPEGISYSILLMNAVTPIIDRYIVPRRFGYATKQRLPQ